MYIRYYGLKIRPFENTPDPLFLFMSKEHREVLASLIYGVYFAKGFVLVTGDIGTGKTTLIHAVLKKLDPAYIIIHIINPRVTFNDMVSHLAQKLGLSLEDKDNLKMNEAIHNKLEALDKTGGRAVLIIDEAHLLSEELLEDIRLLSNIENEKKKLVQIILVGQNEIYSKLQKDSLKSLKQRLVFIRSLKPLDKKETLEYIQHRLHVAGRQSQLFNKRALSLIWEKSRGIPRLINQICDNALLIGFALKKSSIDHNIIKEVIEDMETGHRYQKNGAIIPFHKFKWAFGTAAAVLLIAYLSVNFITGKPLFLKNRLLSNGDILSKSGTRMPIQNVLTNTINGSSTKVEKTFPIQRKSKQMMEGPLHTDKPKIDTDRFQQPDPERSLETNASYSQNGQKLFMKVNSAEGKSNSESRSRENNIVKISQQVALFRPPLSKPNNESDSIRKKSGNYQKKVNLKDYLGSIAYKEYGISNHTIIDLIHMANPSIKDVNLIYAGQKITIPHIEKKDLIVKDENGCFHIHYASFYNFENAQKSVQKYIKNNKEAFIIPALQGDNLVYRVYLGILKSSEEAEKSLKTLKLKYLPFLDK